MTGSLFKITTVLAGLAAGAVLAAARGLPAHASSMTETHDAGEGGSQDEAASAWHDVLRIAKLFLIFLVLLGVGGLFVATSGIIPIKASSGHWAITALFLDFSKTRSVTTNTIGLEAPPLDEPWLALKGAGHYETGCRPCHGSPALPQPRIAWKMTPPPPYLAPEVSQWEPEELFYIVKHGIKFTGMPAWPSLKRDDEVWAMVAFLRKFPGMNEEEYRQLAQGEASPSGEVAPLPDLVGPESVRRAIATSCARCHGADGGGRGLGAFPRLAGQKEDYLELSLQAYARGQRHSGIMEPISAGLSQEELSELARYYSGLPHQSPPASSEDGARIARGAAIARAGIPGQRVPACASCHGPSDLPRNPVYPVLEGQYADYLALQLRLFKQEQRGGTAYAHLMRNVAAGLSAEQMREVASYYASLSSAPAPAEAAGSTGKLR